MNPRDVLEGLEEKAAHSSLSPLETQLLNLVRRVVARVDHLFEIVWNVPDGCPADEWAKQHENELAEIVYLMGPSLFGNLMPLPEPEAMGVVDHQISVQNQAVFNRRKEARDQGWFIEAISLAAYQLEEWLRTWIVSKGGGDNFHQDDRLTLGQIITDAEKLQFDAGLLTRARRFNKTRTLAIHRLLRGEIAYADLAGAYDEDPGLPGDASGWVLQHLPTFEEADPEWDALGHWIQWATGQDVWSRKR